MSESQPLLLLLRCFAFFWSMYDFHGIYDIIRADYTTEDAAICLFAVCCGLCQKWIWDMFPQSSSPVRASPVRSNPTQSSPIQSNPWTVDDGVLSVESKAKAMGRIRWIRWMRVLVVRLLYFSQDKLISYFLFLLPPPRFFLSFVFVPFFFPFPPTPPNPIGIRTPHRTHTFTEHIPSQTTTPTSTRTHNYSFYYLTSIHPSRHTYTPTPPLQATPSSKQPQQSQQAFAFPYLFFPLPFTLNSHSYSHFHFAPHPNFTSSPKKVTNHSFNHYETKAGERLPLGPGKEKNVCFAIRISIAHPSVAPTGLCRDPQ